jgi:hypothetical protein
MAEHRHGDVGVVVGAGDDPGDPLERQRRLDLGIGIDVDVVVPVDELVAERPGIKEEGDEGDEEGRKGPRSSGEDATSPRVG